MKLSVVIVNYNVKYYLEQCIDSLSKAIEGIDTEVFVVDNCSTDGSVDYLQAKFPWVIFHENRENVGFSRANNQAIERATGEYILLLNPDTVVGEETLENACRFMDENPLTGALGVKMLDGFGDFLPESKRGFPSPWNSFVKMTGLARLFPQSKIFGGYYLSYLSENEDNKVDVLAGAFMLLRRTAIEKTGGLDNSFFMYGEDIDLSYRIRQAGFDVCYLPEPIIHYKGECTKKDLRYVKLFYEAMIIFFDKHYRRSNRVFRYGIKLAILAFGFLSVLQKVFKIRRFAKRKKSKTTTFSLKEMTYGQIIMAMDENKEKDTLFRILNPERGICVDAEESGVVSEN